MKDLIKALWRGEIPLARTYWLFGAVAGLFFGAAFLYIEFNAVSFWSSSLGMIVIYGLFSAYLIYFLFIYIAIWRSAGKYPGPGIWAGLARVAVVLGVLMLFQTAHMLYQSQNQEFDEQWLVEAAEIINKNLPIMIDEGTRLDKTEAGPSKFNYRYTLIQYNSAHLDAAVFRERMEATLKGSVCGNADLTLFFANGVQVTFSYWGNNGAHVADITVSPSDCGY